MFMLYTSDFHFSADNSKFEVAKKRLNKLATAIVEQGYNIDVFIFTGDIIDARSISLETIKEIFQSKDANMCDKLIECLNNNQIIKPLLEEQMVFESYCEKITQKTNELFKKTRDVLKSDFLNIIGVTDPQKMIICCGNHDILRFENAPMFRCGDGQRMKELKADDYQRYYESFLEFGNELLNVGVVNYPKIFTIDEYSFLVIDSNIINEHGKACIQCRGIESQLKQLSVEARAKNIAISHKPFFDCCENVFINYDIKNKKTISEQIKEKCSFVLFGDKHGQYIGKFTESEEMLFGSPLTSNSIHYCILKTDTNDGHLKEHRNILWDKNNWSFSVSNADIIINFCKDYFSKFTCRFIGKINIHNIISTNFMTIEILFKNIAHRRWINEYKKDCLKTLSFSFEEISNYLSAIYNSKRDSSKRLNLFNFRGRPSTGKTFLSNCLFCYLFKEFYFCRTKYVPMYFSLNPILKECSDSYEEYSEIAKQKFDEFINNCDKVAKIFEIDVLCIIDGLEEKNCYNSQIDGMNIENYIIDTLNDLGKYKYILAFDQTIVPLATENLPHYKLVCDFLYYLRRLDVVNLFDYNGSDPEKKCSIEDTLNAYLQIWPYHEDQEIVYSNQCMKDTINMSLKLQNNYRFKLQPRCTYQLKKTVFLKKNMPDEMNNNRKRSKVILASLLKLRLINVNYKFLHSNIDHLANTSLRKTNKVCFNNLIDILETRHSEIYSDCKTLGTNGLCPVAYNYYINGLTYNELKEKYHINFRAFRKIKNDEELLQYLTAIHYVNTMQIISNGTVTNLDMSIFSCFIPRNISLMIRWYIERNNKLKIIDNFVNYLLENDIKIPYQLKSVLFYLAGFLNLGRLLPLVKNLKIDDSLERMLSDELISFNKYCVERSEEVAGIICCKEDEKRNQLKKRFVDKLFDDEHFREMNRVFQYVYYGDNTLLGYNGKPFYPTKDIIYKGFDFYNTFLTLIAKFDFSLKKRMAFRDYILIDLDLFTLCDIIYYRLQNFKTCDSQISFYYNSLYKDKAVATLKRTGEAIHKAIESGIFRENCRLNDYFNAMVNIFEEASRDISNDACTEMLQVKLPYGSPKNLLFDFLDSLSKVNSREENEMMGSEEYKRACWLCFNAAYIALFFLPDNKSVKRKYGEGYCDYDKNLVVSLLLLGDNDMLLGNNTITKILSMSAPCGFGNLTEYFDCLHSEKIDSFNINSVIAKDIYRIAKKCFINADESNEWAKHLSKICEPIYDFLILKCRDELD